MSSSRIKWLRAAVLPVLCCAPLLSQNYTFVTFNVHVPHEPSANTLVWGINNLGGVVGYVEYPLTRETTADQGFRRGTEGQVEYPIIDPADGMHYTEVQGINKDEVIVGQYEDSSGIHHGFMRVGGVFTTVDVAPGPNTLVFGINNLGDFVGSDGSDAPGENGFVSHNGVISPVQAPGMISTVPFGIAWDGTIVGVAANRKQAFGFLRGPAGKFKLFTVAGARILAVRAINNVAHLLVGYYSDQSGVYHGFSYDYLAGAANLSGDTIGTIPITTIDYPGALLTSVTGINDKGQIAGWAVLATGQNFGFIGTPNPQASANAGQR